MMLVHVARARHAAQQVLAVLVLVGAARFAYASFEHWSATGRAAPASGQQLAEVPRAPGTSPVPTAVAAAGAPAPEPPPGELITVVLSVSHGNRRSEVFLDDGPLGHTVYLGHVPCRRGADVTIRIQPKRGAAIEHVRRCDGSDIAIDEP